MSQHDYVIDNQTFPNTRTDLNNALAAIATTNAGATAPSTTYAYQLWYDTTTDFIKMRNADNDAWITLFELDQTNDTVSLPATSIQPNPNLIINGAFQIWQRQTSATTVSGNDIFAADRFKGWANGGGTYTVEQSTDVPNNEFEFSAKLTNTATDSSVAAGDFYAYATDIEGYNVSQLAYGHSDAKAVTLSFWVKSSLAGTYCIALYSTIADRSHIKEYTISSANTWEKKTITISSGDTTGSWNRTNGNGLRIYWDLGSGSTYQASADTWLASQDFSTTNQAAWIGSASATFFITGVKLEVGLSSTSFIHEDYNTTLVKCQRYYQKPDKFYYGHFISSTDVAVNFEPTVSFRAAPTATLTTTSPSGEVPWLVALTGSSSTINSTHMKKDGGDVRISGFSGYTQFTPFSIVGQMLAFEAEL